jgi:hypothetical protein
MAKSKAQEHEGLYLGVEKSLSKAAHGSILVKEKGQNLTRSRVAGGRRKRQRRSRQRRKGRERGRVKGNLLACRREEELL